MATNDDSRPFSVLRQNAEEFKSSFDEDIAQCLAVLDSRITALLCDQDSVIDSFSDAKRLNAHMEFSRAKLDIFNHMKNFMSELEASWAEQLADLKETFIENVEIFLAGTKLDVNLPEETPRIKKGRKGNPNSPFSPIYPKLLSTAKHIPVLNALLPKDDDDEDDDDDIDKEVKVLPKPIEKKSSKKSPSKKGTQNSPLKEALSTYSDINPFQRFFPELQEGIQNSPLTPSSLKKRTQDLNTSRRKNSVRFLEDSKQSDEPTLQLPEDQIARLTDLSCDRDNVLKYITYLKTLPIVNPASDNFVQAIALQDEVKRLKAAVSPPPQRKTRQGRSSTSTPSSVKKTPAVKTPVMSVSKTTRKSLLSTPASLTKDKTPRPLVRGLKKEQALSTESGSSSSSDEKSDSKVMAIKATRSSSSAKTQTPIKTASKSTPKRQTRTSSKKSDKDTANNSGSPKSPNKNVNFSLGLTDDDLEIYSPVIDLTRSTPRRKTVALPKIADDVPEVSVIAEVVRSKSKRKTIGGSRPDLLDAPSPKRLKRGRASTANSSVVGGANTSTDSDFLESDEASKKENYTAWLSFSDIGGKIPTQPGVYEVKVSQAKKPAYIGSCESLRQRLTLHKLKHNSGHKHLDKFIERNAANIFMRYEKMSSLAEAKAEEKNRVDSFVARYKTTPAYN